MFPNPLNRPAVVLFRLAFAGRVARLRLARARRDVGASAIELAIITAILVGLAVAVLAIITTVVHNRGTEIQDQNGTVP
jgi:hypothetical protein